MHLLLMAAVLIAVLVVPVLLAARLVGAGRTGFGSALLAVIMQVCLSGVTQHLVSSRLLTVTIGVVAGSAIFAFVLNTTWLRGFVIGLLSAIIGVIVIFLFASGFAASAHEVAA